MNIEGRVALVTGAGHRLGRAIALHLADAGANVVVHYGSSADSADETAKQVRASGREAITVSADLGQPDEIDRLFERVRTEMGGLDVLVNSAASFRKQSFARISPDDWDSVLDVNLRGPFLCTQRASKLMRESARGGPGAVVNIADLSGQYAWLGYVQHGVSKAGLLHLTQIAARSLGPDVRVNAIVPGPILPPPGVEEDSDAWQAMGEDLPLGRTGDPRFVAETVSFLVRNDFVTGAVVHVDGGQHLLGPAGH